MEHQILSELLSLFTAEWKALSYEIHSLTVNVIKLPFLAADYEDK
jgi:hypothetical protein